MCIMTDKIELRSINKLGALPQLKALGPSFAVRSPEAFFMEGPMAMDWYRSYPDKWIGDDKIHELTLEQEGAYRRLIDYLYKYDGEYPENIDKLRIIFRVFHRKKALILWQSLRHLFVISEKIITHPRVTKEIQRIEHERLRKSKGGKMTQAKLRAKLQQRSSSILDTRYQSTDTRVEREEGAAPANPLFVPHYELHPDSPEVILAWCEHVGLQPDLHRDEDSWVKIDKSVRVHGADRVREILTNGKKVTKPGFLLSNLDRSAADGPEEYQFDEEGNFV